MPGKPGTVGALACKLLAEPQATPKRVAEDEDGSLQVKGAPPTNRSFCYTLAKGGEAFSPLCPSHIPSPANLSHKQQWRAHHRRTFILSSSRNSCFRRGIVALVFWTA